VGFIKRLLLFLPGYLSLALALGQTLFGFRNQTGHIADEGAIRGILSGTHWQVAQLLGEILDRVVPLQLEEQLLILAFHICDT